MKVLIAVFQVFVMVMVVLFLFGYLEVMSYRTVNKPLAYSYFQNELESYEDEAISPELFQIEHWTIVLAAP